MKTGIQFFLLCLIVLPTGIINAQGMFNKLKNKANQEVNKLENGKTSSAQTQTQPNKNKLSANVTRSVAVKMSDDETFDYGENCIDLGNSLNQVAFIVYKRNGNSNQCFAYTNGTRTPVTCPTGNNSGCQTSLQCSYSALKEIKMDSEDFKKYVTNETESHTVQQPAITDQQMKAMAAYMTPAQLEEMKKSLAEAQKQTANQSYSTIKSSTITFNEKKFGPFQQLLKFYLTPDAKNFYALVGEKKDANSYQTQNKVITSASTKILLLADSDSPTACLASPDNSDFGYVALEMTSQKYVIKTSSGKSYDMPMSSGFADAWYSITGNHVVYLSQSQLYLDGQVVKTFTNEGTPTPCDLFVSSDGKGVTQIKNNKISFSDGDYFEYPLKIAIVDVDGKPYYKWLALENNTVVVYQKPY